MRRMIKGPLGAMVTSMVICWVVLALFFLMFGGVNEVLWIILIVVIGLIVGWNWGRDA